MAAKKLVYRYYSRKPIIVACVRDVVTKKITLVQMVVDTGADHSCFPARLAKTLGYDNLRHGVKTHHVKGIGGHSKSFLHKLQICLIRPDKSKDNKPVLAWQSKPKMAPFVKKLSLSYGIIGMDLIDQWRSVSFERMGKRKFITMRLK